MPRNVPWPDVSNPSRRAITRTTAQARLLSSHCRVHPRRDLWPPLRKPLAISGLRCRDATISSVGAFLRLRLDVVGAQQASVSSGYDTVSRRDVMPSAPRVGEGDPHRTVPRAARWRSVAVVDVEAELDQGQGLLASSSSPEGPPRATALDAPRFEIMISTSRIRRLAQSRLASGRRPARASSSHRHDGPAMPARCATFADVSNDKVRCADDRDGAVCLVR